MQDWAELECGRLKLVVKSTCWRWLRGAGVIDTVGRRDESMEIVLDHEKYGYHWTVKSW